jgi:hypothetical protein
MPTPTALGPRSPTTGRSTTAGQTALAIGLGQRVAHDGADHAVRVRRTHDARLGGGEPH